LNPRPLGYEPYDIGLSRLKPSLTGVVTSADRTDPISLCRLRLPRLKLSRSVRFTNRFTERAIGLQFPYPFRPAATVILGTRTMSGFGRQRCPRSCPTLSRGTLAAAKPAAGNGRAVVLPGPFPRTRLLRDLAAGGFCPGRRSRSRSDAAGAPWTDSGWREHSYGGFGGGHRISASVTGHQPGGLTTSRGHGL
jgi:hypothetical protein